MTTRKLIEQPEISSTSKIIASLNSLNLGKMEVIGPQLAEARQACRELDENDLFAAFIQYLRTDPRFYHDSAEALLDGYRAICKKVDAKMPTYFGILPREPYGVKEIPAFMAPRQTTVYFSVRSLVTQS